MIRFDFLEENARQWHQSFASAAPFSHIVIDEFAKPDVLSAIVDVLPDPEKAGLNKSRDYVFAKNKFEKSEFRRISDECESLYQDFVSERFSNFLCTVTGEKVFVDPEFHGGGVHQGGAGSFLDMHTDFNYHPLNSAWFRNINILLYLNQDWRPEHGGQLKLRHKDTGEFSTVEPLFNRCVIMHTREFTLHGYDSISFPDGEFRRSVAAYAYSLQEDAASGKEIRSTTWYPEQGGRLKKALGKLWPSLVRIKSRLVGSGTAKNK